MCGIFSCEGAVDHADCAERCSEIRARGPDSFNIGRPGPSVFLGFHRLAIMDPTPLGNQPFEDDAVAMICNGEIYNSRDLVRRFNLTTKSRSDCETILHLYKKIGLAATLSELDGVFAFVLFDKINQKIYYARDCYGVRPLFLSILENNVMAASELKALYGRPAIVFPAGQYWSREDGFVPFMETSHTGKQRKAGSHQLLPSTFNDQLLKMTEATWKNIVRTTLIDVVRKQMQSDRQIGCLLSGGLDSSLLTGLVCKHSTQQVSTYSIGLVGSTDLAAARLVADFLKTDHHEVIMTEDEGLSVIEDVIRALETWDVTTIRASVPMFLLSRYIASQKINGRPRTPVVMSGEGADEVCQGYLYFHDAPSADESHLESVRLIKDLLYFDVLRSDRCTASNGLEVRVPFLDKVFVDIYMSIPPEMRRPTKERMEKFLLRSAFEDDNLIPSSILWRKKEAFSDGVSGLNRSWYKIIQELAEQKVSDAELTNSARTYAHCPPRTKEGILFRKIFMKNFPEKENVIPYQWMPRWQPASLLDPSARELNVYKN